MMMSKVFFLSFFTLFLPRIDGILLINTDTSSIIVVRHIRLNTDYEYHRIRCPYRLQHLTLTLLNYSNDHCFQLQTKFTDEQCLYNRSPCRFYAKPIRLDCHNRAYTNHVDITYQCSSFKTTNTTTNSDEEKTLLSSTPQFHIIPFQNFSLGMEESLGIVLVSLILVCILWLTVCSVCFLRCGQHDNDDDENNSKCELLAIRSYDKSEMIDLTIVSSSKSAIVGSLYGQTSTGGIDNVCLHVNPLDNQLLSSSKITQID